MLSRDKGFSEYRRFEYELLRFVHSRHLASFQVTNKGSELLGHPSTFVPWKLTPNPFPFPEFRH